MEIYYYEIGWTSCLWVSFLIIRFLIKRSITSFGSRQNLAHLRVVHVGKVIISLLMLITLIATGIIWNVSLEGLALYLTSFFTIAGIGLFASWSILSNVTAALILFFYYPYRIGDRIKILDGDNSLEGTIKDMTLFTLFVHTESDDVVVVPNNVILQKNTVKFD